MLDTSAIAGYHTKCSLAISPLWGYGMLGRKAAVLLLSLLLIGFSLPVSATAPDFMDRPGTVVHALSLPIGSSVYLDAVYVGAIAEDHFTVYEWWNKERTIAVYMTPPPALTTDELVDVQGTTSQLACGGVTILNPIVYGYLDKNGNLFPNPWVIKMPDKPADWPWGKVDMSTIQAGESLMAGMETMELDAPIEGTIGWAKQQDNTVTIDLTGKEVVAGSDQFDGCIYIEEADRSSGIKVATTGSFEVGDIVDVSGGTMATSNGEYYIAGATVTDTEGNADPLLGPVFMINRNLGGEDFGYQEGMLQGFGPNTIGLLVRCCGAVKAVYPTEKCFYIDDGSALYDQTHTGITGIKVSWDDQATGAEEIVPPEVGSMVIIRGISTTEKPGDACIPILRPRDQGDIGEYPDETPPNPGVASSPPYTSTTSITVEYRGASDGPSGIDHVELWYKKGATGGWLDSGLTSEGRSGYFEFDLEDGEGIYYFDLVAEDNAGNRSDEPAAGSDGDCSTIYDEDLAPSGRAFLYTEYLYPGGPVVRTSMHDESGLKVRAVARTYGQAGELLSLSGSTDNTTYSYDPLYRVTGITDGRGKTTTYVYDDDGDPNTEDPKIGALTRVVYPGEEVVSFPEHDPEGRVLKRVDLGGTRTTTYQYFDPDGLLTEIAYPTRTELFE
jgi:hypothetical protein